MERWARGPYGASTSFVMACVDARDVAVAFGKMFQLQAVVNGWIPGGKHMPDFGQLGCSGFIIVGKDGRCIERKTAGFLQHGPDAAFADVERILTSLAFGSSSSSSSSSSSGPALGPLPSDSPYAAGATAVLEGLAASPELNGRRVVVLGFDTDKGRFVVSLEQKDGKTAQMAVRPCNLAPPATGAPSPTSPPLLSAIAPPPLTGCSAVDAEHGSCVAALNALLSNPSSAELLSNAVLELSEHFDHEELLLKAAGWGGDGGPLSALGSHAADHRRILRPAREELERREKGGRNYEGGTDPAVARALAASFCEHAKNFDVLFEGQLPSGAK
jgi:hypothetical protein